MRGPRRVRPESRNRRRGGFSLIELLLVMVVIGILAAIVLPNYRAVIYKARAVEIIGDLDVIEQAAREYQADNNTWPPDSAPGVVPSQLLGYLPVGFEFSGEDYLLDWANLGMPGGIPADPNISRIMGVGAVTTLSPLGDALAALFGSNGWFMVGSTYVKIIDRQ